MTSNISLNEIIHVCSFNLEECDENDFEMNVDKFGFVSYRFKQKKAYTPGIYEIKNIKYMNMRD